MLSFAAILDQLGKLDAGDWIAIAAGLIALGSFWVAFRANRIARAANALSGEANTIARDANALSGASNEIAVQSRDLVARSVQLEETAHDERRRGQEARARLVAGVDPTELRSSGGSANFPLTVTVQNEGERDSGHARVELFVPLYVNGMLFKWEDEIHDPGRSRIAPEVKVPDARGRPIETRCLDREVENITPAMPARLRVVLPLELPKELQAVPLRVVVHAEHAAEPMTQDLALTMQWDQAS